jgi:hypothetical protein
MLKTDTEKESIETKEEINEINKEIKHTEERLRKLNAKK